MLLLLSLKTVTNLFLANSDFKFTGKGFSLPQLDSGVSGKTNELGMKQGQLGSFLQKSKESSRESGERLARQEA